MATDGDFNQAFASFARRENLPAALTSEEWSTVPSEIRERAFFMSRVTDAEILQRFREGVEDMLTGRKGQTTVEKELFMWLGARGYRPPEGLEGSLQDLSSLDRINVVLRTNVAMAYGHASWVRKQTAIRGNPCQRLYRGSPRLEPRDWDYRWSIAKEKTANVPGVHETQHVALLNHPIWVELSRFNNPYPPFDFNSGMAVESVGRDEALQLGFNLDPDNDPMQQAIHRSMNEGLEVTPQVTDPMLRGALADRLGRFGEWDGEKLVFTDPDGTRKYPPEKLAEIWARPAPADYDILTQKDALDRWKGGSEPEAMGDRVTLRKLFERIITSEAPEDLWRAIVLSAADVVALVRGLASRILRIPPDVAGWEMADTAAEAMSLANIEGNGWTVLIRVNGSDQAVDIRALRPDKPGFVIVGGAEFKVSEFHQDVATRIVNITLTEP